MNKAVVAKIAISQSNYSFDKEYDYTVPNKILPEIKIGCRVLVPFGFSNKNRYGLVLSLIKTDNMQNNIKPIAKLIDKEPILNKELVSLVFFIKRRYYCTFFEAIKAIIPTGLHMKAETVYKINNDLYLAKINNLNYKQKLIADFIYNLNSQISEIKLCSKFSLQNDDELLLSLIKSGVLIKESVSKRKIGDSSIKMVGLNNKLPCTQELYEKLTIKQRDAYDMVAKTKSISVKELCYFLGITSSVINSLVKKNLINYFEEKVYRNPCKDNLTCEKKEIVLTSEQQKVYNSLVSKYYENKYNVSLLYGITGSGKTSVFMKLIDKVYNENKGIIVMVPEISLTPQMLLLFRKRYGNNIAVFHSGLSLGERLDEWKRVKDGKAKIAIGTRSAIFAPFNEVGLIIIDEEQEYTYKSDSKPRFHARDIAKFRCAYNKGLLVLSSATPSVESFYFAKHSIYSLNTLSSRYGKAILPEVSVVDMNTEILNGNESMFSSKLLSELDYTIKNKNQAILLLNRRGHNTFASCRACKKVLSCPNCSISLSYHSANGRLMCHYCGYSIPFTNKCPNCNKNEVNFMGAGTQKVESELENILKNAKVLRMDADSTMSKSSYQKKLSDFANCKYDVMVGTQMVAKGLDFENVTLVGVLSADQSLYNDDFRSYERTFSLLTQVVGRAGRGEKKGKAIIQTFTPENGIIKLASEQNYEKFYDAEINMRKALVYPPFADICVVVFTGENNEKVKKASMFFFNILKNEVYKNYSDIPLKAFAPSSAIIAKINNKYRYRLIVKFKNSKKFQKMMSNLLKDFLKNRDYKNVTAFIDINPDIII